MAVSTVQVQGADGTLYDVAGEIVDGVFYPIYKTGFTVDGAVVQVDSDNPQPVIMSLADHKINLKILDGISQLISQQKIANAYHAIWYGQTITEEDL